MKTVLLAGVAAFLVAPIPAYAQGAMPGMDMAAPEPKPVIASSGDHAVHTDTMAALPGVSSGETGIGIAPAPPPPTDHAADALFDPAEMARSRDALRRDNGAFSGSMIRFDLAEYQARRGGDGYRWEAEAWFGGDIDRLLIKSEGEGRFGKSIADVEVQALYSRAVSPFWNAQFGLRHDELLALLADARDSAVGIDAVRSRHRMRRLR